MPPPLAFVGRGLRQLGEHGARRAERPDAAAGGSWVCPGAVPSVVYLHRVGAVGHRFPRRPLGWAAGSAADRVPWYLERRGTDRARRRENDGRGDRPGHAPGAAGALVAIVAAGWSPIAGPQSPRNLPGAAAGPTAIAVPYLGTATIEPGEGWQITDCAGPRPRHRSWWRAIPPRSLTSTSYDPDADVVTVPVPLSNGRTSMTVDYSVSLAPPEPPTVAAGAHVFPVAAGSVVMLPFSDLGVACAVCAEGGAFDVVDVDRNAGTAASTPPTSCSGPRAVRG